MASPEAYGASPIPAAAGVGFKREHLNALLAEPGPVAWAEVHAENYMGEGGPPHRDLRELRSRMPLSVHGVGLSIGGESPLDKDHLDRLARVVALYEPGLVSEHLAWSSHGPYFLNDLLPVAYDQATLERVVAHLNQVQDQLKRRILLENPSTYVQFQTSSMSELEFISEVARRSGCGLLLDVNNVFVSCSNHGRSPEAYLQDFPLHLVEELHLGGHAPDEDEAGAPLLIDAHDREVADPVWGLYEAVLERTGPLPTLIEWDNAVPTWPELRAEAERADARLTQALPHAA